MPGAVIAFDQARPGPSTSSGSPGVPRKDLWQNREVTARSTASGNTSYAWVFLDIPPGSATTLTFATTANAKFTPDLPGSYRVQLTTNGGGPGNVQVLVAAVTYDNLGSLTQRGWRLPAFGEVASEDGFSGQLRGWAADFEFILADIRGALGGSSVSGADTQVQFNDGGSSFGADPGLTYDKVTNSLGLDATGYFRFGTGSLPGVGTLRFAAGGRDVVAWRDALDAHDLSALAFDASDVLYVGTDSALTTLKQATGLRLFASSLVALGIGGQNRLEVSNTLLSVKVPEVVNAATAQGEARTSETSLRTTDALPHVLDAYTLPNDTMSILDVEVVGILADASLGVWWKKSKAHLSTGGVITEGVVRDVDTEAVGGAPPAWTVEFDVSAGALSSARVRVNSQGDDVTWYIVRQGLRVLKT